MTSSAYEQALSRLPQAYSSVLRLDDAAIPAVEICRQLNIEPDALEALLEIARRKLQTALAEDL